MGKGGQSHATGQDQEPLFRSHNFSAGPAMCDTKVMRKIQESLLNYEGSGMGVFETSHRDVGGTVQKLLEATEKNLRELLEVPDSYKVLFFQGGAHGQFAAMAYNLFGGSFQKADFVVGGMWSKKAMSEVEKIGKVHVAHDALENGGRFYSPVNMWELSKDAAFVHICGNETVNGLAFHEDPDVGPGKVLVSDMTSSLLSRPVDVSKYGVIYASGGKNLGPAGVCVVIVREELLHRKLPQTPMILDWQEHSRTGSLSYTPNAFAIWCVCEITSDLLANGGLKRAGEISVHRALMVYNIIDSSRGFYTNSVTPEYRSHTAIPFTIKGGNAALEAEFIKHANKHGLLQTFGHASVGGLRVAIYNGLPDESLSMFLGFMQDFAVLHGVEFDP